MIINKTILIPLNSEYVTITNYITGDVEDSGDGKAELYLTFYIQKNSEDNDNAYTGNFFKYKLENK